MCGARVRVISGLKNCSLSDFWIGSEKEREEGESGKFDRSDFSVSQFCGFVSSAIVKVAENGASIRRWAKKSVKSKINVFAFVSRLMNPESVLTGVAKVITGERNKSFRFSPPKTGKRQTVKSVINREQRHSYMRSEFPRVPNVKRDSVRGLNCFWDWIMNSFHFWPAFVSADFRVVSEHLRGRNFSSRQNNGWKAAGIGSELTSTQYEICIRIGSII